MKLVLDCERDLKGPLLRIFVLEDDPERIRWFADRFRPGHRGEHEVEWHCVHTCDREGEFNPPYDLILLDHDLGGRQMDLNHEDSGYEFLKLILPRINEDAVVIAHTYNAEGYARMKGLLPRLPHMPFLGPDFRVSLDLLLRITLGDLMVMNARKS